MDRFPIEPLQDIFLTGYTETDKEKDPSTFFENIFARSDRHWRRAALSFDTLRSNTRLNYEGQKIETDMIQTWLQRSNDEPLCLRIQLMQTDESDVETRFAMESVVKMLLAEQHRWHRVAIHWRFKAVSPEFTSIDLTDMPMLVDSQISIQIQTCEDGERILPNVSLARSQELKRMSFIGEYSIGYGATHLLSLREAKFHFLDDDWRDVKSAELCLDALKACPDLDSFHATFKFQAPFESGPDYSLRMSESRPRLVRNTREITLSDGDGDLGELVLDKLTLPDLEKLVFETSTFPEAEPGLVDFLRRSKPPLKRLRLYGHSARPETLFPVLRLSLLLEELIIDDCEMPKEIFDGLNRNGEGRNTCPALGHFVLTGYGNTEGDVYHSQETMDALFAMVESRGRGPTSPGSMKVKGKLVIPTSSMRRERNRILRTLTREEDWLEITF